jgi:uncharacterized protein (DUF2132 family)
MKDINPKNPLEGITLAKIMEDLVTHYGWEDLAERIPIRCFTHDPSVKSSLTFLRRTPWARQKVEDLYVWSLKKEIIRQP